VSNLTSCDITYQLDAGAPTVINWTGNLALNQSAMVNIPTQTTTAGTHTFSINVTNVNTSTDVNLTNNTLTTIFQNINITPVFPLFEGFETVFPMPNWERINPDASTTWARTTTAKKTGVASVRMDNANYAANTQIDEFRLPPLDISTAAAPTLSFQVAYKLWTNPTSNPNWSDTLEVFVSTDCGLTFVSVYKKFSSALATATPVFQGSDFVPTSNQWRLETVDLTPYAGTPNLLMKFRNVNDYENILYIDDINIFDNVVGINENMEASEMVLYPNPATNMVNLSLSMIEAENATISIYNSVGQLVLLEAKNLLAGENKFNFSTENLSSGMYSFVVKTANGIKTQKLAISK